MSVIHTFFCLVIYIYSSFHNFNNSRTYLPDSKALNAGNTQRNNHSCISLTIILLDETLVKGC